jgi:F0F1-type ATP synthase membrane subunit a
MTTLLHHTRIGISIRLKDKVYLFWAEMTQTIQRNSVEVILEVLVIVIVAMATSSSTTRKESRLQALG